MEVYGQVADAGFPGAEAVLLGFLLLFVGLMNKSEHFERLVGSKIKGPLTLAYGTFGLPLMLLVQRRPPGSRGSGGILRFLGVLAIVVIVVIIGVLALIAFLIYRYLNAWCELRLPSQQVGKSQAGTTELLIEPHTEVVQRHSRRQSGSQAPKPVGPLPVEPEGVE